MTITQEHIHTPPPTPNALIRAGCYLRISSDPKDKRAGVDRQREDTTTLCDVKGWVPAVGCGTDGQGFYVDNDRSASNGQDRPAWDMLLADVAAGKIDAIAVWDQDRGWRLMSQLEELRGFFTKVGRRIPLASTGQGDIDLYSPTGVLTAQIKTAVTEHEIAMMKVRMRRAARQKAELGLPQWTRAFGYLGDTRTPDPVTAPLVREAYEATIAGTSLGDICKMWTDAGALTLSGKVWTQPQLSAFLRKPRNAGLRAHNGEIVAKGTWDGLVGESTWRAAQDKLNAPGRAPGRKTVRRHLLTGAIHCGNELDGATCDHYLSAHHTITKSVVYTCKACRKLTIAAHLAEPFIVNTIAKRLAKPDARCVLLAERHNDAESVRLTAEENRLNAELDNIGVERAMGDLTGRQAKIATDLLTADLKKVQRLQQDQEMLHVFDGIPVGTPEAVEAIRRLSPDRLRAVLDVIMKITVYPVGKSTGGTFNEDRIQWEWIPKLTEDD